MKRPDWERGGCGATPGNHMVPDPSSLSRRVTRIKTTKGRRSSTDDCFRNSYVERELAIIKREIWKIGQQESDSVGEVARLFGDQEQRWQSQVVLNSSRWERRRTPRDDVGKRRLEKPEGTPGIQDRSKNGSRGSQGELGRVEKGQACERGALGAKDMASNGRVAR